ncbi:MAG TPA: hypothetical protein VIN56_08420 [Candidatus Dormibacteraeota bacterium]
MIAFEVAVVVACGVLGWNLLHSPSPASTAVTVQHAPALPGFLAATGVATLIPTRKTQPARMAAAPNLADLVLRVNGDDARLYRGQWQAMELLGSATRDYVERHIVPVVLAAARGGMR